MDLKKCSNGHFYDGDKYSQCPHCNKNSAADDDVTVNMEAMGSGYEKTDVKRDQVSGGNSGTVTLVQAVQAVSASKAPVDDDDMKTVSFYGNVQGKEPLVGWLVCIDGNAKGKGYELKTGKNFIGRSSAMDVILEGDNSVSRERHAIITFEPKGRRFIAQPGESRELFYLNEDVVLENMELKYGDVVQIGKTQLKFVPFCGPDFSWEN
ncbi:MAG: hypothetical protein K0R23_2891 [Lacrimispora sp.]|jgi:hypothetical protein|nr:hypothetical protein [Lacrimispora sp.]